MSLSSREFGSSALRAWFESAFEVWGHFAFRHPWPLVLATAAFSAVLIAQLPKLKASTSADEFLKTDDPIRVLYVRLP